MSHAVEMRMPFGGDGKPVLAGPRLDAAPAAGFVVPSTLAHPGHPFAGTLSFSETRLATVALPVEAAQGVPAALFFPAFRLSFVTVGENLLPATLDPVAISAEPGGPAVWDLRVGKGKVWKNPTDEGWSHASFSFSLVPVGEGEVQSGHASFRYNAEEIGPLSYEILPISGEGQALKGIAATGVLAPRLDRETAAIPEN